MRSRRQDCDVLAALRTVELKQACSGDASRERYDLASNAGSRIAISTPSFAPNGEIARVRKKCCKLTHVRPLFSL